MDLLRIEIKSPVLTQENVFKLNLTVSYTDPHGTRQEYNKEYILDFSNSIAYLDDDGIFHFVSYIYQNPYKNSISHFFLQSRANQQDYRLGMNSIRAAAALFNDYPEGCTIPDNIIDNNLFAFFNKEYTRQEPFSNTSVEARIIKHFSGTITLYNRAENEEDSEAIVIKEIDRAMVRERSWHIVEERGTRRR